MKYRNNPYNIRYNKRNQWVGQIAPSNGFCQFATLEAGIRAYFIILRNYGFNPNIQTLDNFVNRFAPPTDKGNDVNAYCTFLRYRLSLTLAEEETFKDDYLTFENDEKTCNLALYQAFIESGSMLPLSTIKQVYQDVKKQFYNAGLKLPK